MSLQAVYGRLCHINTVCFCGIRKKKEEEEENLETKETYKHYYYSLLYTVLWMYSALQSVTTHFWPNQGHSLTVSSHDQTESHPQPLRNIRFYRTLNFFRWNWHISKYTWKYNIPSLTVVLDPHEKCNNVNTYLLELRFVSLVNWLRCKKAARCEDHNTSVLSANRIL